MRQLRVTLAVIGLAASSHALAQEIAMSCMVQDTTPKNAQHTWELSFDPANQLAYIADKVATAAITTTRITFRVDLGTGVPFSFDIDRASGAIRVTGSA